MKKSVEKEAADPSKMTVDERLALVGNLYVVRNVAKELFDRIDLERKRIKFNPEPENLMLIGESGMGKTTLLTSYLGKNPSSMVENCIVRPVVYVSLNPCTKINGAATELLRAMEVPRAEKGSMADRTHLIETQLKLQKVEVVLVDESQHVVEASGAKSLPKVGDFFKVLSKKAKVIFVLTGMPLTKNIFDENTQLQRLCHQMYLGPFTSASDKEFLSFRYFLRDVDKQLPFIIPGRLADPDLARLIFAATEGKIYNVMNLIREAAMLAIESGHDGIQREHLKQAFDRKLDSKVAIKNNPFDPVYVDEALQMINPKAA